MNPPVPISEKESRAQALGLDSARLPRHLAIIMDGNGRWAEARGLPRAAGHKAGVDAVRRTVRACGELGIQALTLYAFSTENWLRPKAEVAELMRLLCWALRAEVLELGRQGVRLRSIGRLEALPADVREELERAVAALRRNTGLTLTLALNYGGRTEIVDAVNRLLREDPPCPTPPPHGGRAGRGVTEEDIARHLYTAGLPELDLVIRTSGEMRLSNFLLWQAAYAELFVTPVCWPDFDPPALVEALRHFQGRRRRFGGL